MTEDPVILTRDGHVGVITLNRPDKRNAINDPLRDMLYERLEEARRDPAIHVIVLRGAGKSFCAGFDLSGDDPDRERRRRDVVAFHERCLDNLRILTGIWDLPKPVVAAVQGHALGAGCIVSMICDLTVAAENAVFGEPEIRYGSPATAGLMPWLVGAKRARELIYMGDLMTAAEAREAGIVNRVVPNDRLEAESMKYAHRLALIGPEALSRAKLAVNRSMEMRGFRNALNAAVDVIAPLYTADTPVMREFREKTEEVGLSQALKWRGAQFGPLD
ncbi:MAG: enoyl-CoA hydratase/isomerase family protein [Rhodospirillaceae bacterium]